MIRRATVEVPGGDIDCSRMVEDVWQAVGVLPKPLPHFWTGNEREVLREHGFVEVSPMHPQVGDVAWKAGHTEMIVAPGIVGGARIDESGNKYGYTKGDQTGYEVSMGPYRPASWTCLLRYFGPANVNGIPANVAAALVARHFIEHDAHGYSQPNRDGDGTVERVTIEWDDGRKVERELQCIITIKDQNTVVWFDGENVNDLTSPANISVLDKVATGCTGERLPRLELTGDEFARLCQAIRGTYPKHLQKLVEKYSPRSPE